MANDEWFTRNAGEPYSYARQKLWEALQALVSSQRMSRRLGGALASLAQLDVETQVPPEMREEFVGLMAALGSRLDRSDPQWTTVKSTAPKSDQMAEQVLGLFVRTMGGL